jgi:hypothetical protein
MFHQSQQGSKPPADAAVKRDAGVNEAGLRARVGRDLDEIV